jgi:hypothetical protein
MHGLKLNSTLCLPMDIMAVEAEAHNQVDRIVAPPALQIRMCGIVTFGLTIQPTTERFFASNKWQPKL